MSELAKIGARGDEPLASIKNPDGSESSELLMSVGFTDESGQEFTLLLPTVVADASGVLIKRSEQEAIKLFKEGKNRPIGRFDTAAEADEFAARRSSEGGRFSGLFPGRTLESETFDPIQKMRNRQTTDSNN